MVAALGFELTTHPKYTTIIFSINNIGVNIMLIQGNFLCSQEEFDNTRASHLILIECLNCKKSFQRPKKMIIYDFLHRNRLPKYCSPLCKSEFNFKTSYSSVECQLCKNEFYKRNLEIKKSPNNFCSKSCAAIFNNKNKTHGTRRSKLEIYLEQKLKEIYPNLEILFNSKKAINSELDIYIPSLKLAFELNGIFHYEPIFGNKKLNQTQNNDSNKFQKCQEKGISLCIIDTSSQKCFTELSSQKYLDIINNIINGSPGWNRTSVD